MYIFLHAHDGWSGVGPPAPSGSHLHGKLGPAEQCGQQKCKTGYAARKPVRLIDRNKITNDKDAASCTVMSLRCQPKLPTVKKYLHRLCRRRIKNPHEISDQDSARHLLHACVHTSTIFGYCVCIYIYSLFTAQDRVRLHVCEYV